MMQVLQRAAFEKIQKNDQKLLILKNFAKAIAVVLFSGNDCPHCEKMKEIFNAVEPHFEGKVHFCTINLSEYPELVEASADTLTNITYVPYVLVYVNNIPYMRYEGSYSDVDFSTFLTNLIQPQRTSTVQITQDAAAAVQNQGVRNRNPSNAPVPLQASQAPIQPIILEKSSFLTMREAYS